MAGKTVEILALKNQLKGSGSEINSKTTPAGLQKILKTINEYLEVVDEVSTGAGPKTINMASATKIFIFKSFIHKDILDRCGGVLFADQTIEKMKQNLVKVFGEVDEKMEKKLAQEKFHKITRMTHGLSKPESFSDFLLRLKATVTTFCDASDYANSLIEEKFRSNLDRNQKNFLLFTEYFQVLF